MKKKFNIKLTRPIVGKRFGVFQHIMKGSGSDKVDMRKYSAGDSASQINRKLSAKYQELYTNIFQQEKSLSLDMFFDINYNRRGGKISNEKQVLAYAEDIVLYCQKQQINITFFSPEQRFLGTTKLVEKMTRKNTDEIRNNVHDILATVKKTKKIYTSLLNIFLQTTVKKKQRRAIVIFSDFLAMDEETKKLLHYLRTHHILFLFQLPIDTEQGQNYSKFFMKKNVSLATTDKLKKGSNEIELLQVD
ncbi:MAG: DUF58 domain-containing protein [Candidatus Absconditabacterales bacterium]